MSQNNYKHEHINICSDIVCSVVIRIDKMGFHRRYDFVSLYAGDSSVAQSWGDAIEWAEVFNAFCRNALTQKTDYRMADSVVFNFSIDDGSPALNMYINNRYSNGKKYSFAKLECLQIYSKMSKILSKCDLVPQEGY